MKRICKTNWRRESEEDNKSGRDCGWGFRGNFEGRL